MKVKVKYEVTVDVPETLANISIELTHRNVVDYLEKTGYNVLAAGAQVFVYRKITPSYQLKPVRGFVS